jgi:magnesium chelatase accessory protein
VSRRPEWEREGRDWPHRATSRFVTAGGLRWHVQVHGDGPPLWLLHGTGAASHSWRDIAPRLADRHTVVVPDLPGHGFSDPLARPTLPAMAAALAQLSAALQHPPTRLVGHSAGAAIAAQWALSPDRGVRRMAWINPALLPFDGLPGLLFAPLARWMAGRPTLARLAARHARNAGAVERLIAGTGSTIDAAGIDGYRRLVACPGHVAGALAMMAHWRLEPLRAEWPRLTVPVMALVGSGDRTVPPDQVAGLVPVMPALTLHRLPGLGHLAHEERPAEVADRLAHWFED